MTNLNVDSLSSQDQMPLGAKPKSNCPLCDSSNLLVVGVLGRGEKYTNTTICLNCSYLFSLPRLTQGEHSEIYASGNFSKEVRGSSLIKESHLVTTNRVAIRRYLFLRNYLGTPLKGLSVLEAGSGTGSFLRVCKSAGAKVLGVEPDQSYADESARIFEVDTQSCTLEEVGDSVGLFDICCSFHVIEHVVNPVVFLKSIKRLMKPNGLLYLECPGIDNVHTQHINDFFWRPHINIFTKKTLQAHLIKAGLTPVLAGNVHGGFIHVLARNSTPIFPPERFFDSPKKWIKFIKTEQQQDPLEKNNNSAGKRICDEVVYKLRSEPADFVPAIGRRLVAEVAKHVSPVRFIDHSSESSGYRFLHFGLHRAANAGDTVLFECVRRSIECALGQSIFEKRPLRDEFLENEVEMAFKNQQALLVGGGGLIIPDSNPNDNSGWQFNCTLETLKAIKSPIVFFAIGYNSFRNQEDFSPCFLPHITESVRKSVFFGVRNSGSLNKVREILPKELEEKVVFQPCPTTILGKLSRGGKRRGFGKRIAINAAFDREQLRNPTNVHLPYRQLAKFASSATRMGWQVTIVSHLPGDNMILPYFHYENVDFFHVDLTSKSAVDVIRTYEKFDLVLGMRGHSQMIPFGLGIPIFSLISHDKMQFFLNDIGKKSWGVEMKDPQLFEKLEDMLMQCGEDSLAEKKVAIEKVQESFFQITMDNICEISKRLKEWDW